MVISKMSPPSMLFARTTAMFALVWHALVVPVPEPAMFFGHFKHDEDCGAAEFGCGTLLSLDQQSGGDVSLGSNALE